MDWPEAFVDDLGTMDPMSNWTKARPYLWLLLVNGRKCLPPLLYFWSVTTDSSSPPCMPEPAVASRKGQVLRLLTGMQYTSGLIFSIFLTTHLISPLAAAVYGQSAADKSLVRSILPTRARSQSLRTTLNPSIQRHPLCATRSRAFRINLLASIQRQSREISLPNSSKPIPRPSIMAPLDEGPGG